MDIAELLTHFNLTKQEATIYLTLFSDGALTGYEVAKLTGISRSNTYTALAGLVEKGAAYMIEGTATRYTPVDINEFCDTKITELEIIKQNLIKNIPKRHEEVEGYITIKSEKHILNKMKSMLIEATERVYISMSGKALETIIPILKELIAKDLKVVIITNAPFELTGAIVHHTEEIQNQIRLIVDSKNVLTGDIIDGENSTCLFSKKQNLIDLFKDAIKNEIKLIELTAATTADGGKK